MKIVTLGLVVASFLTVKGDIIYVDANAAAGGDGSSWATAFNYLQDALDESNVPGAEDPENVDQIWIAKGTYFPDDGATVTEGDRAASFLIKDQVELYGGFSGAGTETELSQRDWKKHPTILSGEISDEKQFWSVHVLTSFGQATLDGLTITKGNANGQEWSDDARGGAVYGNWDTWIIAKNCEFIGNSARSDGGVCYSGNWDVYGCRFIGNTSSYHGGVSHAGNWNVRNCVFSGNRSRYGGVSQGSDWNVNNSVFVNNSSIEVGAVAYGATWSVNNCLFLGLDSRT